MQNFVLSFKSIQKAAPWLIFSVLVPVAPCLYNFLGDWHLASTSLRKSKTFVRVGFN